MARRFRFKLAGVPQHVVQRGNNRGACFFTPDDYRAYRDYLREAARKYGCQVHAYVLMTNHVHLLVSPSEEWAISRMMQSIGRGYVRHVNGVYRRTGTLWEGRFRASLVESEHYLLACYCYIELNPVRAGIVKGPAGYLWSSYGFNGEGRPDPVVDPHERYLALGPDPLARAHAYRGLVRARMEHTMVDAIRAALQQELVLGTDRFKDQVERQLKRPARAGRAGRPRVVHPDRADVH